MARNYRVVPSELTLRATTSTGVQFQLFQGMTPLSLAGYGTVELWLKDKAGGTSMTDNLTGALNVNGTAGGSVLWTPGTGGLVAGSAPYGAYFRLKSGPTSFLFLPEANELTISVRAIY